MGNRKLDYLKKQYESMMFIFTNMPKRDPEYKSTAEKLDYLLKKITEIKESIVEMSVDKLLFTIENSYDDSEISMIVDLICDCSKFDLKRIPQKYIKDTLDYYVKEKADIEQIEKISKRLDYSDNKIKKLLIQGAKHYAEKKDFELAGDFAESAGLLKDALYYYKLGEKAGFCLSKASKVAEELGNLKEALELARSYAYALED